MQLRKGCREVPFALLLVLSVALAAAMPALAGDATVVGAATATAPSSRWIAVEAPLAGDNNRNGYSSYEIATSFAGPFNSTGTGWAHLPGPGEWRATEFGYGHAVDAATAAARDDEIFVSVPIADDADLDSFGTVDVATGPGGRWTRKCGDAWFFCFAWTGGASG